MLVKAQPLKAPHPNALRSAQEVFFQVTGTSLSDPARRGELQRLDQVRMAAVVHALTRLPDETLTSTWWFDSQQPGPKLSLSYGVRSEQKKPRRSELTLADQLEHALREQFEITVAENAGNDTASDQWQYTFAIESTLDRSSLSPVSGRWSSGLPLAVRETPSWDLVFQLLAGMQTPVAVRMETMTCSVGLQGQVDQARRAWELHQGVQRFDQDRRAARGTMGVGVPTDGHSVGRLPTADSSTRWPTKALASIADLAGGTPLQLRLTVSSSARAEAFSVATALCDAVFECGTARVVEAATAASTTTETLLDHARTLVRAQDVARVLAFPRIEAPYLLPMTTADPGCDNEAGALLGTRFDELVWKPTDVVVRQPWLRFLQHQLVSGINGSGKSVLLTQLIAEAARADPAIPVLFMTFAKDEGSGLLDWLKSDDPRLRAFARKLRIYGPHPEAVMPIRISPFANDEETPEEVADVLCRLIQAAVTLEGPLSANVLDAILSLRHAMARDGSIRILNDLIDAVRQAQRDKGYSEDVCRDLGGAFESRISKLTQGLCGGIFRAGSSQPAVEEVLERPHVVSLGRVDVEIAAMFVVDFLLRLERHLVKNNPGTGSGRPRLIIIMDEVQVVAPRDPARGAGDQPVASMEAARLIRHAVKVLRGLGVVVIIASQHPGSIDEELVKAVGGHLALAQNQTAEKDEIAGLMGLDGQQIAQLNGLSRGQAFFRGPGMASPLRIATPFEAGVHDHKPKSDADVAAHYAKSQDARALTIRRCDDELTLREARYIAVARALRQDRHDLNDLAKARETARAETQRPEVAGQILREVDQAEAILKRRVAQRTRRFERQWSQTLRGLPAWLTQWAAQTRRHAKQRRAVESLCRRHARLERAYQRLSTRSSQRALRFDST